MRPSPQGNRPPDAGQGRNADRCTKKVGRGGEGPRCPADREAHSRSGVFLAREAFTAVASCGLYYRESVDEIVNRLPTWVVAVIGLAAALLIVALAFLVFSWVQPGPTAVSDNYPIFRDVLQVVLIVSALVIGLFGILSRARLPRRAHRA